MSWWPGNGAANDIIGGNHGVFSGPAYTPGHVGQAFSFDGSGNHVRVPAAASLDVGLGGGLTIEAWINPADLTSQGPIVEWAVNGQYALHFYANALGPGHLYANLVAADTTEHPIYTTSNTLNSNSYQHVALTYDRASGMARLYHNGIVVAEATLGTFTPRTASDLYIGYRPVGSPYGPVAFHGQIDEVSIYDRALTVNEIQALFAADSAGKCLDPAPCTIPGMIAWWRADGDAQDSQGTHDGVPFNGAAFAEGKVGSAFDLTAPGSHVRVPDSEALRFSQAFTVEAWVKPLSSGTDRAIAVKWDAILGPEQRSFVLALGADDLPYLGLSSTGGAGAGAAYGASAPVAPGRWAHVAGTYNGEAIRIYVDGQLAGEAPYSSGIFPGTSDLGIGGVVGGTAPGEAISTFAGFIDELSLYNRALTRAEIAAIYQAGALGKCASPPTRQPLARWAFDETEGATASDSVGTRHGTLSAAGAQFTGGGVRGNALRLTRAEGGHVNMGNELTLGNVFTLVAWVKTEPNDTTETLVVAGQHAAGTVNGYYLALNRSGFIGQPGNALFVASNPVGQELVSTSPVNDGQWHQVVAVYENGGQKRLYVDGQPAEASGPAAPLVPNTAPFLVGGVTVGGMPQGFFHGWIDEVQVYGRALADAEVEYLFRYPDAEEIPDLLEPRVLTGLVGQTVERGATVELAVEATGEEPLSYEWRKDGVLLEEAQGPVLVLSAVRVEDGGVYEVQVSNRWGNASSSATLRVLWPPVITQAPVGQGVSLGGSVTLSVTADGAAPLQYMWLRNGRPVSGASSRFLLISNATAMSAGDYQVRVANADGMVVSDPVKVWVYSGVMAAQVAEEGLQFDVSGLQAGRTYLLEYAAVVPASQTAWQPLVTVVNATASFQFTDPEPPAAGNRYYRVTLLP